MKLQRTTLVLLILALGMGAFVYFFEVQGAPRREAAEAEQQQLFAFAEEDVQLLTITTPTTILRFERTSTPPESADPSATTPPATGQESEQSPDPEEPSAAAGSEGAEQGAEAQTEAVPEQSDWMMQLPKQIPANNAAVTYLVNLLATSKGDRTFPIAPDQRQEYGLAQPQVTVEVTLDSQQVHRLLLGQADFSRSSLYALVDPANADEAELEVTLVPYDFQNAVERPLTEWEQQPATAEDSSTPPATEAEPTETLPPVESP